MTDNAYTIQSSFTDKSPFSTATNQLNAEINFKACMVQRNAGVIEQLQNNQ